jgi:elongation factor Ts
VSYVHNAAAPGMGKIGVLVAFTGGDEGFARQVAMHVAAVNPAALNEAELDPADRREGKAGPDGHRPRKRQARAGDREDDRRPDEEIPGRVTLLNQQFVVNPDLTVAAAAKEAGVEITGFVRLEVGEGIEVEKEDFAAEVAKAAKG